ncbi:MAG: BamA/TamA family outer membrane protein [Candidatus Omnitrophica bacterium]|nr:BamA/TamA family outer membrane protein [Candidatus Omnitrophota bacterium]
MKQFLSVVLFVFLLSFLSQDHVLATTSYDPYAPVSREERDERLSLTKRREFIRPVADIFALPFDIVKLALDPVTYEVESRHIPRKLTWIYDELKEKGIKPFIQNKGKGAAVGLDIEAVKLARLEERLPGVAWHNKVKWISVRDQFLLSSAPKIDRIFDTPLSLCAGFQYELLGEEDFWGIGPDSGLGQGSNYEQEKTQFTLGADFDINFVAKATFDFGYEHVNIAEGHDSNETHGGGKNNIKAAFPTLEGINGSDEINFVWGLEYDRRNNNKRPTKGHREKITFGYHHGVRGSDARYFEYLTDLSIFVPVFSERRVLAVRFYGEHNNELDSDEVPFFNKARLGGHQTDPEEGLPLRSFERNRFFDDSVAVLNIEYRYNIWHYRDYKLDAVVFFDEGQVFDKFSEIQWGDFQESYGGGFRVYVLDRNIFTAEIAHGNEGTEFYARTGTVF